MALLQLALLPLLGWRCHPLGAARIRTLFGVPDLVSFSDPVKSGKDTWKEGAESKKLPRKSIQYYLAMYPRINGQVSSITLPSNLGSIFCLIRSYGGRLLHIELFLEEACGVAVLAQSHLFGLAATEELPASCSTFRSQVYHMVGTLDDIHIVLDDDKRMPALDECVKGIQQASYVVEMKAGGRLVEDEYRGRVLLHTQIVGQLHALVLTA